MSPSGPVRSILLLSLPLAALALPAQASQYPLMDMVVEKVLAKYQNSTCTQLAAEKAHPPTGQKAEMKDRAVELLRQDPKMRTQFINRVAAPIANKLFACGMIP